jgi:CheY-like chemotaxis protein
MMPVMTGWEFRAEQQRHADLAEIPVVVTTALGDTSSARRLGAAAWLTKPFPMDELLATLERCC